MKYRVPAVYLAAILSLQAQDAKTKKDLSDNWQMQVAGSADKVYIFLTQTGEDKLEMEFGKIALSGTLNGREISLSHKLTGAEVTKLIDKPKTSGSEAGQTADEKALTGQEIKLTGKISEDFDSIEATVTGSLEAATKCLGAACGKPSLDAQEIKLTLKRERQINCILYMQYANDPVHNISNEVKRSAEVLRSGPLRPAIIRAVSKDVHIEQVLADFKNAGYRCKSLSFMGHNNITDGSMVLPYKQYEPDDTKAQLFGGKADGASWIGDRQDAFDKVIQKIKEVRATDDSVVTFYTCGSAVAGGVAEQVNAQGIHTQGTTDTCDFGGFTPRGKNGAAVGMKDFPR